MTSFPGPEIPDEALSAYVDGALTSAEAAEIARRAAASPEIAQRIAVLHQLKAGVAAIVDDVMVIDPPKPLAKAPRGDLPRWGLAAAALAAALALSLSLTWPTAVTDNAVAVADEEPLADYVGMHDAWIETGESAAAGRQVTDWVEGLMQATGLGLAHESRLAIGEGGLAQHLAFIGPKGCRLSLFEASAPADGPAGLDLSISAGLLTARWAAQGYGYVLVARDMDRSRFVTIAAAVHEASKDRGTVDAELLADLRQARQPCLG